MTVQISAGPNTIDVQMVAQTFGTVTVLSSVGGTTNPAAGDHQVVIGETFTIQAIPSAGYEFECWGGPTTKYPTWTENPTSWTNVEPLITVRPYFRATTPPQTGLKPVCVFHYSGWSSALRDTLIATKPRYVVIDIGTWPVGQTGWAAIPLSDIAMVNATGIKLIAYLPANGMRGYLYEPTSQCFTAAQLRAAIDEVASRGFAGVWFDEGGLYTPNPSYDHDSYCDRDLVAPGAAGGGQFPNGHTIYPTTGYSNFRSDVAEAWKGLTMEYYLGYAKSKGLFTVLNYSENGNPNFVSGNVFDMPSMDRLTSSENYNTRGSYAPMGVEAGNAGKCWVISYSGNYDVPATLAALANGFEAAYCAASLSITDLKAFSDYMAQIPEG